MRVKHAFSARLTRKSRKDNRHNRHSVAFSSQVAKLLDESDIILEVLDARFIEKSRNIYLEKIIREKNKNLIFVLNKADLVDINELKKNYDLKSLEPYVLFSSKNRVGRARLKKLIGIEASRIKFKKKRVGIVGYPNTGKSTLINVLAGGKKALTSAQSGQTRHLQKIKFTSDIVVIDSPGVIGGGEENSINPALVAKQTEIGVRDYSKVKYPDLIINKIMQSNPGMLEDFYSADADGDVEVLLEKLGKKWNYLKKGREIDTERTARRVLKDWQEGKIR